MTEYRPNNESPEWERLEYFKKHNEKIGEFSPWTIIEEFKESGRCLGPLPKSILTLTTDEANRLRTVNYRSYSNWISSGGKISNEQY